ASGSSCPYVIRTGDRAGQTCGRTHTQHRCFSCLDDDWQAEFGDDVELPCLADLLKSRIAIFDLDFDAILFAIYALSVSAEGDCYRCVPPDPGIAAAALGASESGTLPGTTPPEALHTFTTAALQDAMVTTTTPGGSSLYTLATEPSQVAASAQVSASGQVAASCSCRLLSHQTLLWHHRLGHPSLPRLRGMHSHLLVSGLPTSLPPLPPSPTPPCLPCVEGQQRAAPHSSSFPPTTAPLQTLHMDVWGPARVSGQSRERYFLLVVDDYTRYTTVFPLRSKGQSFTLPDSPHQNGIAEHRIGLVMDAARTSMIHAAAPHFLWPFAVRYTAHQLNLWPRVSLPETSPTLRWTGEVGDASVFRVWGSRAFVRDTFADKLSPRAIPCVFLGFDVTFYKSVPFYRLFPYRSAPPPPPPLFLSPGPPPVDPLSPQGPAPSGVSQVDPLLGPAPVQVAVGSGAPRGAASGGAEFVGVETRGADLWGVATGGGEPGGAEPKRVELGGVASEGAESGGVEPQGAALSGGTRVVAGAGVTEGTATTSPGGAHTLGTGAVGAGAVEGDGAGDPTESEATGVGGAGAGGAGVGGPGAGGAGVGGLGVGGAGAGGAGAVNPGGAVRPRPYFVPLLQQVLGTPPSAALTPPVLCPPPNQSQPPLQPASPLPAPSPYTEQSDGLTERRELASCLVLPVCTARRSSRPEVPDPESDRACAASPTISRLLATVVTDPSLESAAASALVAELLDFAVACRLDYATSLVAEYASASPPSVGGECALGTDVLEDRQEDFECLAAAVPRFGSMLLAPEGDPDAPDIPTPRSYAEAITGPYSSQWQAAMDAEMTSWKSTGTYVDEVPQPGANIVDGMWIFRVKRPPGSPPTFKARYVARGFSQRQGVDYFQTFSPTPKMTTLRVLIHVIAQRDYELHSLDFSTAILQGSQHEEIWLRRPPGFTESFPAGTQWILRQPNYSLRQVPREWHDTLRTTLAALGFAPATTDPSLILRTDTSQPHFYVLVYVDDLVFATAATEALTLVKSELQKRLTCTDLGPIALRLPVLLAIAHSSVSSRVLSSCKRALHYLCNTSGMGLVLGGRGPVVLTGHACASWVDDSATQQSSQGYTFSLGSSSISWRSTRLSSVLSSSCEAEIYARVMAAEELRWLTYLLTDLGEQPRSPPILYVDNKAIIALCQKHRLEHRMKHIALRYFLA
ncbi:unnamed protein product, partial [Closterium sp. NIES-53]